MEIDMFTWLKAFLKKGRVYKAEQEVIRLKEFNDSLVQSMSEGLVVEDQDGYITFINTSGAAMLGTSTDKLIGKHWTDVIPPDQHDIIKKADLRRIKGESDRYEVELVRPDGVRIPVLVSGIPRFENGAYIGTMAVFANITIQKQAEAELRNSQERYRATFEGVQDAIFIEDLSGNILDVNVRACEMFGWSREEFRHKTVKDIVPPGKLILASSPLPDVPVETVNIRANGESFPVEITGRIQNIGGETVLMVVVRDISARVQRERQMEAIAGVAAALRTITTTQEMFPIIIDQVQNLFNARGAGLVMTRDNTGDMIVELGQGEWEIWVGEVLKPGEGISAKVAATGVAYWNNDLAHETRLARPLADHGIKAAACVPLTAQERTVGVLWIGREIDISKDEVDLMVAIGDIAANAIYRASLYEATQRRIQRLAALRNIDITITSSLDLRLTLDILLGQVTAHLNVDAACILLFNANLQQLEFATGHGFRSNLISRTRLRLGEGHAGRAALERDIIHIDELQDTPDSPARRALLAGENFMAYYAVPLLAKGNIKGVLEIFHRSLLYPDPEWMDFLEALGTQAAIAIDNTRLFDDLQRSNMELIVAYDATLEGWVRALDLRDKETEGHTQRVTTQSIRLSNEFGMSENELLQVRRGALLHDIGKMGIPDSILRKPGPLNDDEWVQMRMHPQYAYELLSPISYLHDAIDIPYCHHEKWDGTGYPRQLCQEEIPIQARIFAVVDVWDALCSDRPYRLAWPEEKVLMYLREQSGKHFDPRVVEAFLRLREQDQGKS